LLRFNSTFVFLILEVLLRFFQLDLQLASSFFQLTDDVISPPDLEVVSVESVSKRGVLDSSRREILRNLPRGGESVDIFGCDKGGPV
jgi:hypothetical protein